MSDKKSNVSDTIKAVLKSNTMLFVLVGVMILFEVLIRITGHGSLFAPANVTNIIRQNASFLRMSDRRGKTCSRARASSTIMRVSS